MIAPGDLHGAAILGGIFLGLLVVAEIWARVGNPPAEWTRKFVHMCGGLACLLFPFLIESPWVVLVLALVLASVFLLGARGGFLHSLHRVERRTRGSEYYPLAIWLTFVLSHGMDWVYVSAVLVLALADAGAGLVGSRMGRIRFEVQDESKSLEGSLIFFAIAFVVMIIPAALLTPLMDLECLLAVLLVAALVTGFELIAIRGTDNLFVPLGVSTILPKITSKSLSEMAYQNLSLVCLALLLGVLLRRTRRFNIGGAVTFILFTYGAWSLGNEQWALPILTGFLLYGAVVHRSPAEESCAGEVKVREVVRPALIPFLLLIIGNFWQQTDFFYGPFVAACGVVLGTVLAKHFCPPAHARIWPPALGGLTALTVAAIPWGMQGVELAAFISVFAVCLVAVAGFLVLLKRGEASPRHPGWLPEQFVVTLVAAGIILLLQWVELLPSWNPAKFAHPF